MIGLHVPFTGMSFQDSDCLLLKGHRLSSIISSEGDTCTEAGILFVLVFSEILAVIWLGHRKTLIQKHQHCVYKCRGFILLRY